MTNNKDFNDEVNEAFKDELNQGYEKSKRKKRQNDNLKTEYIQKLSNEKALAEAIIIGNKPYFIVVDFSNVNGENTIPTVALMESLAFDNDTQFKPEDLSNRPYSFRSKEEFDDYVGRAKNETLDSLYRKTKALWNKYIDADDFHISICGADTMFSYKQDVLGMTHYLFFVADNDAGKSNNLNMLNILGYRNLMSTSITHANIYNFLGSREEGIGTLCIDEADNIDQYPELMGILKEGYTKGHPVVRIVDTVHGRKQLKLNTYCFKALAGERLPDATQARGFLQRTIALKCLPGYRELDISEIISPAGDENYEELLNELLDLRNLLFCYFRVLHFKDKIPNIKLNIHNREKQLFKPLFRMFQGTRTFEELKPVIASYINERRKNKANSFHAFLYKIVRDLIESTKSYELQSSEILRFMKLNLEWKEIVYKPQSIETVEFGILSMKQITTTLKEVFQGEPPKHKGSNPRSLIFKPEVMERMKDTYEMDMEIKILAGEEVGAHGAHGAHSGSVGQDQDMQEDEENQEVKQDRQSDNSHNIESEQESPYAQKAPQAPQAPQSDYTASILDELLDMPMGDIKEYLHKQSTEILKGYLNQVSNSMLERLVLEELDLMKKESKE